MCDTVLRSSVRLTLVPAGVISTLGDVVNDLKPGTIVEPVRRQGRLLPSRHGGATLVTLAWHVAIAAGGSLSGKGVKALVCPRGLGRCGGPLGGERGLQKVCQDLACCHPKVRIVGFDASIRRGVNTYHGR